MISIKNLESEGKIIYNKKTAEISLPEFYGLKLGKVISQSKHFSFVKIINDDNEEDIYIDNRNLKGAIYSDLVFLTNFNDFKTNSGLKRSAVVYRIIKKGKRNVIGIIKKISDKYFFIADNYIRYPLLISKKGLNSAKSKDKVIVNLFNTNEKLSCKVVKRYGECNTARVSANAVLDSMDISTSFSKEILKVAEKISKQKISQDEISKRIDLREELIFTIDGEDSKDLDDAISIKKEDDHWVLGVHIADVSHYVELDSNIDIEARKRGTSIYFADKVIPMFPEPISNGICSLNENEDKLAISVIMDIDFNGKLKSYDIKKSIIRSKVRGVYSEINEILNNKNSKYTNKYKIIIDSIYESKKLANKLQKEFKKKGSIDIESNESKLDINTSGKCIDVRPRIQGESEKIIESFMITANECIASYAKSLELPFVYRVHEEPNKNKIDELKRICKLLGLNFRFSKTIKSSNFNNLLKKANDSLSKVVSNQILRTMQKARYEYRPLGHFGLALLDYCHFTSPIRRYPDLAIHRILTDLIEKHMTIEEIYSKYNSYVKDVSKTSSASEIQAMQIERLINKIYIAEYMTKNIGEVYTGVISGMNNRGIFVELSNTVEGFINLSDCNKYYVFKGITSMLIFTGSKIILNIGDEIEIKVMSTNISNGQINFRINFI